MRSPKGSSGMASRLYGQSTGIGRAVGSGGASLNFVESRPVAFEKEGRYWLREDLDPLFEAPAPYSLPGEDAPRTRVEVDGLPVVIIGVEDLFPGVLEIRNRSGS